MKHWEKAINYKWRGEANHAFLLYLNIADYVLNGHGLESVQEYIISASDAGKAAIKIFFNRGKGIYFINEKDKERFFALCERMKLPQSPTIRQTKVEHMLEVMSELLTVSWNDERQNVSEALKELFPERLKKKNGYPVMTFFVEYLETIVPPDAATSSKDEDRDALVGFLEMATSKRISSSRNIVVFLAESINAVPPPLSAEVNGIAPIKIELPDASDRVKAGDLLKEEYPKAFEKMSISQFAHLTSGMTLVAIVHLVREASAKNMALTPETIFEVKKKYVREQSGGLLEIIQPIWGIEAIGGLPEHKKYILEVVNAMKEGDFLAVPMAILLLGAQGVGKTVFMEATARHAGIPLLKMKNQRNPYVGMSEKNQDFSIEIIKAIAPAIVGIDEIDQKLQMRGLMADNTGVNNRLQGQLFEVMSDTDLRGKILWMAISNMPNLLDAALLDRFEARIPFFPPDHKERAEILPAILTKMKIQAAERRMAFEWDIDPEFCAEFGWITHFHLKPGEGLTKNCNPEFHQRWQEAEDEWPVTGRKIEKLVNDSYRMASLEKSKLGKKHLLAAWEELTPTLDILTLKEMSELAILYASSDRFILEGKWKKMAQKIRAQRIIESEKNRTTRFSS